MEVPSGGLMVTTVGFMVDHYHQVTAAAAGDEAVRVIRKAPLASGQVLDEALAQRLAASARRSLAALSCTSAASGARVPVPTFPDKQWGTDTGAAARFGSGNETQAQLEGRFGGGNETQAQLEGRAAARFGGGNETQAQLEGRAAARFGSGNETQAQLAARAAALKPGHQYGRARLKQVKPRRWSGQVVHKECGQVLVIDRAPQKPNQAAVNKWCKHCKKTVNVSTKELAIDLCDSDSDG